MKIKTKEDRRDRIKYRIRKRVRGTEARPRLTVYRSVAHVYVQVVDDMTGRTIASASSLEPKTSAAFPTQARGGNIAGAQAIGPDVGQAVVRGHHEQGQHSAREQAAADGPGHGIVLGVADVGPAGQGQGKGGDYRVPGAGDIKHLLCNSGYMSNGAALLKKLHAVFSQRYKHALAI